MHTAERDLDRCLTLLRNLIRKKGFTQLEVQQALGWGRSYISQLLTKQKELRYTQILLILDVIGVTPEEFFANLHPAWRLAPSSARRGRQPMRAVPAAPEIDVRRLTAEMRGLVGLLQEKGHVTTDELAKAIQGANTDL